MSETYLRGTDQQSCVVSIMLGASTKLHRLRCHVSPPKTELQHADKLERKPYDILCLRKDDMY